MQPTSPSPPSARHSGEVPLGHCRATMEGQTETATEGQHEALCRVCALPTTPGLLLLLARPSAWQLLIKQSPPLPPTQRRRK